jgi:hypothetical protein
VPNELEMPATLTGEFDPERSPPTGTGLILGGVALSGTLGAMALAAGMIVAIFQTEEDDLSSLGLAIPLLTVGTGSVVGGWVMMGYGFRRRKAYKRWKSETLGPSAIIRHPLKGGVVLSPALSMTRHRTGTYGVSLRF